MSGQAMSLLSVLTVCLGGLALILVTLRRVLFRGPVRAPEPLPLLPIVDIHCHCAGLGVGDGGVYLSPSMRSSWKLSFYLKSFGITERELIEQGDAHCVEVIAEQVRNSRLVDSAVVLALDAVYDKSGDPDWDKTVLHIPNRFLAPLISRYPQLHFGASVHPHRKDALEALEWCKENGAVLVKWLPAIQLMDPADRDLRSFYLKLRDLDLPLLTHVGDESSFDRSMDEFSDPEKLRQPLDLGVRVIAAHIGAAGHRHGRTNFESTIALMREYPNLWADISALSLINRKHVLLRALREPDLFPRYLYGTDYPLTNMPLVSPYYFPRTLRWGQMRKIAARGSSWDRDVLLKQAVGVPGEVFASTARFLGLAGRTDSNPSSASAHLQTESKESS